jgi:uncharacterized membrane protein
MHRKPLVIGGCTLVSVIGVILGPGVVGIPFALLLVAVLPGLALADALFGPGGDLAERMLAVVGLSLATVVLGGLLLDVTAGITRTSFAVFLGLATISAAGITALRPRRTGAQFRSRRVRVRVSLPELLGLLVAVALTVGAVAYARKPLHARGVSGYSILWIHPAEKVVVMQTTSGDISVLARRRVEVAVVSQEIQQKQYLVVASTATRPVRKWELTLQPGERWHAFVAGAARGEVRAVLYVRRNGSWAPYRHVRLVL